MHPKCFALSMKMKNSSCCCRPAKLYPNKATCHGCNPAVLLHTVTQGVIFLLLLHTSVTCMYLCDTVHAVLLNAKIQIPAACCLCKIKCTSAFTILVCFLFMDKRHAIISSFRVVHLLCLENFPPHRKPEQNQGMIWLPVGTKRSGQDGM